MTEEIRSKPTKESRSEDSELLNDLKKYDDKTIMKIWDYHYVNETTEEILYNMAKNLKSFNYRGKNKIHTDISMLYNMYNHEITVYHCMDAIYIYKISEINRKEYEDLSTKMKSSDYPKYKLDHYKEMTKLFEKTNIHNHISTRLLYHRLCSVNTGTTKTECAKMVAMYIHERKQKTKERRIVPGDRVDKTKSIIYARETEPTIIPETQTQKGYSESFAQVVEGKTSTPDTKNKSLVNKQSNKNVHNQSESLLEDYNEESESLLKNSTQNTSQRDSSSQDNIDESQSLFGTFSKGKYKRSKSLQKSVEKTNISQRVSDSSQVNIEESQSLLGTSSKSIDKRSKSLQKSVETKNISQRVKNSSQGNIEESQSLFGTSSKSIDKRSKSLQKTVETQDKSERRLDESQSLFDGQSSNIQSNVNSDDENENEVNVFERSNHAEDTDITFTNAVGPNRDIPSLQMMRECER